MANIKNSHIQGDLTISSNLNEIGSLNTNFIEEATSSSGVSILLSDLKIGKKAQFKNNSSLTTDLQLDNDNLFKILNNTGPVNILSSGNKGIIISDITGNVLINSTTDSIDENTGSLITTGGAVIGKTLTVKENVRALDGLNFFKNTSSSQNVIDIVNTNVNGSSTIVFKNSSEASKLEIGYGNAGLSSPLNDTSFIQSVAGSELLIRANSQNSIKLSTNASVDFYSTLSSTSSTVGSVRFQGGLSLSNTTDATSSTSGGSFTTAGGLAIAKKLFVGGQVDVGSNKIVNLLDPTAPQEAATKYYVDNNISVGSGIILKDPVRLATTIQVSLSTGFENGDTIDGIVLSTGDRILVKNQTNGVENGVYVVNVSGSPSRASDLLNSSSASSTHFLVEFGNINTGSGWLCTNASGVDIVGVDSLVFKKISSGGETVIAGTGLTKIVNTLSVNASQTQITELGTITTGSWNASIIPVLYGGTGVTTSTGSGSVVLSTGPTLITPVLGVATGNSLSVSGNINSLTHTFTGSSSGIITFQTQAVAGTYNYNLPTSSGTSGQVLTSGGGGSTAMSWTTPITSISLEVPSFLNISGSPLTSNGTLTIGLSGVALPVINGGTGVTSLTSTGVLIGNGTSPISVGSGITYSSNTLTLPKITTNDTTASTSPTAGAVLLSGGVGISNTTDAVSSTNGGSLTTSGGVAISKKLFVGQSINIGSFLDINYITTPSLPIPGYSILYIDNVDQNLKSHNSTGLVKIYNPNNTKGDLVTHNGTTDVRLPGGSLNQILYADSSLSSGIGWKDLSTETSSSNPLSTKYLEVYNSATQTVTGSFTDIIFESVRTTSNDAYTRIGSNVIKFLESGTYIIMSRISLDITSGTTSTRSSMKLVLDNNNDTYVDVTGSTSSLHNRSASFRTGSTSNFVILDISANQKLKVQVIRNIGTSTLTTVINGCNLIIIKSGVDFSDSTKHFNAYTNTNTILTTTFADIPLNIIRQTDSPFTFTSGTSTITISESGKYMINYGVGCDKTTGADLSSSENRLILSDNTGLNFVQVNGSLLYTFHVTNGYTISNSKFTCLDLLQGQIIKIQSRIYTGTNLRTSSGSTFIGIVKFQSTSSGQTTPKFLNITNSTNLNITNSYTDLTFNTNDLIDAIYSHSISSEEIAVSEEGKYIVICGYSANVTSGDDSVSQLRLLIDSGSGYSEIAGSISGCYHPTIVAGVNSCLSFITINMSPGSKIKGQAIRSYGTQTIQTSSSGINISIIKIDSPEIAINALIKFGTFYRYIESLGQTSTTSLTYIDKLTLTTDTLLEGYYRIGVFYTVSTNTNNGELDVRVLQNNSVTIFENTYSISSNNVNSSCPFYSPKEIFLTSGIHNFIVQFKSITGTSNIRDTKIEFWRVK